MNTTLEYSRERDPVHLKAAYLEWAEPDVAREHMRAHIDYHTMRRDQWADMITELRAGTNEMLSKRLAATPEADRQRTIEYKVFTYEGLIARAETEIEWAKRGLKLIDALSDLRRTRIEGRGRPPCARQPPAVGDNGRHDPHDVRPRPPWPD